MPDAQCSLFGVGNEFQPLEWIQNGMACIRWVSNCRRDYCHWQKYWSLYVKCDSFRWYFVLASIYMEINRKHHSVHFIFWVPIPWKRNEFKTNERNPRQHKIFKNMILATLRGSVNPCTLSGIIQLCGTVFSTFSKCNQIDLFFYHVRTND